MEKVFNDDNTLKNNYNNQIQLALQSNIYKQNEINESGIEPFPVDSIEDNYLNENIQNNINFNNNGIPKKRVKTTNCECCIII